MKAYLLLTGSIFGVGGGVAVWALRLLRAH